MRVDLMPKTRALRLAGRRALWGILTSLSDEWLEGPRQLAKAAVQSAFLQPPRLLRKCVQGGAIFLDDLLNEGSSAGVTCSHHKTHISCGIRVKLSLRLKNENLRLVEST